MLFEIIKSISTGLCRAADVIITMCFIPLLVVAYTIDTLAKQMKKAGG